MTTPSLMDNLPEISRRIDRAGHILLGLDFDGTLAPICSHPEDAFLAEPVREVLARLARLPRVTVMIVSGRGLADVASRVGLPQLLYAGNHGMEIQGHRFDFLEPTAAALIDRLQEITSRLEAQLSEVPGALVEPKRLTASVHYRNVAPELWDVIEGLVREALEPDPDRFVLSSGNRVWEIRPSVDWHKGQALDWTLRHIGGEPPGLLFYLGDDRTDEDAFERFPDEITVKIGDRSAPTAARFQLPDPAAVRSFLEWLASPGGPAGLTR